MSADVAGKRLLILSSNRYNLPSIRHAKAMGFTVLLADRNPHSAGFPLADVALNIDLFAYDELLAALEKHGGVDGIVTTTEAGVRPMAELSQRLGLPNITPQAAMNATSKAAMRTAWADTPYSVPFRVVSTLAEAEVAVLAVGLPCLLKPDKSFGGSRGVSRIDSLEQVAEAFAFAQEGGLLDSQVVIEAFVLGSEHSTEVLIYDGKATVLCVGEKVKSPYPYRVDVSVQYPANMSAIAYERVQDMAQRATQALGLTQGVAHIEFALHDDIPTLFELGARCGGGHTPQIAHHVSGVDAFGAFCRMACGLAPEALQPVRQLGADYRFLIYSAGVIADIEIPDDVRHHTGVYDVDMTVQKGDKLRPLRTTADRAGFAVCFGQTRQEAVTLADWVQSQVTIHYEG